MPFAEDSPPPARIKPMLLHKTSFTSGPSPFAALRKNTTRTRPLHLRRESNSSIDWLQEESARGLGELARPVLRPQQSLADVRGHGVRPRMVSRASLPALRHAARSQVEVKVLFRPGNSSLRLISGQTLPRDVSLDSLSSTEPSSPCPLQASPPKRIQPYLTRQSISAIPPLPLPSPSSPSKVTKPLMHRTSSRLSNHSSPSSSPTRAGKRRSITRQPPLQPLSFNVIKPSALLAQKRSSRTLRHQASTPGMSRREPALLRKAASSSALRPVISSAQGVVGSNGAAMVLDPSSLTRGRKAKAIPPVPILPDIYAQSMKTDGKEERYPPTSIETIILSGAAGMEEKRAWFSKLGLGGKESTAAAAAAATTSKGGKASPLPRGATNRLRKLLGAGTAPTRAQQGPAPVIVVQRDLEDVNCWDD